MSPCQKHLASARRAAKLSQTGHIKAVTIMNLEEVLKQMENDSGKRCNPEKHHFTVFGTPSEALSRTGGGKVAQGVEPWAAFPYLARSLGQTQREIWSYFLRHRHGCFI